MKPITLLFVFGTRPEAIKLAPLVLAAQQDPRFAAKVCVSAQHREMLDSVLQFFAITPDLDLDLMRPGQSLSRLTCGVLQGMEPHWPSLGADWVVVQGDTTTAFAAALAAFLARVPVMHVEAGLRTHNMQQPWPEEMNRRLVAPLAQLHFAPTPTAQNNLLAEGIAPDTINVTGNTGIDALFLVRERLAHDASAQAQVRQQLSTLGLQRFAHAARPYVLITAHRRESFGAGFDEICQAVRDLVQRHPAVDFVFPVHPNPSVRAAVDRWLAPTAESESGCNLVLCQPLDYLPFVALMIGARVVLTDSGGVQEEAPSLGCPVVVMRDVTERMEGTASGRVVMAGPHRARIVDAVQGFLAEGDTARRGGTWYGDGQACARILDRVATEAARLHAVPGVAASGATVPSQPAPQAAATTA
ncbi:MAG: hypothetical protein RJA98_1508 [Pseudomonadota bacterium]|jgi:UDP-N-acetylglucosamine 2-epimerase (non-hydrolysing)